MDSKVTRKDERHRTQIKITVGMRQEIKKRAYNRNLTMAEWMENAFIEQMRKEDSYN
jgi:hypothetical protein